jgi:hypothetical protein
MFDLKKKKKEKENEEWEPDRGGEGTEEGKEKKQNEAINGRWEEIEKTEKVSQWNESAKSVSGMANRVE